MTRKSIAMPKQSPLPSAAGRVRKSASASAAKSIASAGVSLMAQKPPAIIVW